MRSASREVAAKPAVPRDHPGSSSYHGRPHSIVDGGSTLAFITKRLFDILASSALLILLSPLLAAVAVAIRIDSPGSPIFVQDRVGARRVRKDGLRVWEQRIFRMYKFRSMHQNADQDLHKEHIKAFLNGSHANSDEDETTVKLRNDPRITRVGRLCRRTSIDELPQLFNVLKGDMSLVGPRPVPPYEVDGYEAWHHERFAALPGMTGSWQVYGRGRVTFEEMMRMDIEYVRHWSLGSDVKLLLLTIPAVVRGAGAR